MDRGGSVDRIRSMRNPLIGVLVLVFLCGVAGADEYPPVTLEAVKAIQPGTVAVFEAFNGTSAIEITVTVTEETTAASETGNIAIESTSLSSLEGLVAAGSGARIGEASGHDPNDD